MSKYNKNGLTHGLASFWTGRIRGIATLEPENFQAVLATKFNEWERPLFRAKAISPLLGPGILTLDGPKWSHSRKLIKSKFTRQRIEANIANNETHLQNLFLALPPTDSSGWTNAEDIYSTLSRFAMDTSTDFLYGVSAGTQACHLVREGKLHATPATISMDGFEQAFKATQGHIAVRMRLGTSYWWHDGPSYRFAVNKLVAIMNTYLRGAIEVAKENLVLNEGEPGNVLEGFVAEERDFEWIANQARHLIIAGFETTTSLLGFSIGLMAEHPAIFEKLRAVVVETFGTETAPKEEITFESLKNCKYLQYFINETLRLFPGGANIQRVAAQNTVLPRGGGPDGDQPIAVPKGATVNISIYVAHRRKDVWGDDAHEFRPERWEGRKKGYDFIPFIAGPQICIGQQYSITQAAFVIVRMLMRYDKIERPEGVNNLKLGWQTVLAPGDGTTIRLHRA
ncbi:putative cytochrome P450 [Microthyrium microscopicum]|uniref:Putative cytochrome P450 n=1 Tax=Microthyrium microscopicum TaxID=703497 RepID=A0A6A6UPX0_9PEZI|nr:putative cytochrome P450 [Microthyrium microscopicum]